MTTQEAIETLRPILDLFEADAVAVRHRANTCATHYARDLWSADAEKAEARAEALRLAVAALKREETSKRCEGCRCAIHRSNFCPECQEDYGDE